MKVIRSYQASLPSNFSSPGNVLTSVSAETFNTKMRVVRGKEDLSVNSDLRW